MNVPIRVLGAFVALGAAAACAPSYQRPEFGTPPVSYDMAQAARGRRWWPAWIGPPPVGYGGALYRSAVEQDPYYAPYPFGYYPQGFYYGGYWRPYQPPPHPYYYYGGSPY